MSYAVEIIINQSESLTILPIQSNYYNNSESSAIRDVSAGEFKVVFYLYGQTFFEHCDNNVVNFLSMQHSTLLTNISNILWDFDHNIADNQIYIKPKTTHLQYSFMSFSRNISGAKFAPLCRVTVPGCNAYGISSCRPACPTPMSCKHINNFRMFYWFKAL